MAAARTTPLFFRFLSTTRPLNVFSFWPADVVPSRIPTDGYGPASFRPGTNDKKLCSRLLFLFFFFLACTECPRSFLSPFSFLSIFPVVPFGFYLQKDNRIFRVTLMFDGICEVVAEMQLL